MIWSEVEEKYGQEMADAIKDSPWLKGITIEMRDGEADIPESDISRAIKHHNGERVYGWD